MSDAAGRLQALEAQDRERAQKERATLDTWLGTLSDPDVELLADQAKQAKVGVCLTESEAVERLSLDYYRFRFGWEGSRTEYER